MSNNDNGIFIIGDFNINYAATTNKDRKLLKEFETMTGLKQIIDQPPRYARNNTTIDLIFTNSEHISNRGTLNLNISDHEIIYITRKKKKEQFNLIKTIGRSYLSYNSELFQSQLINANWDAFQHVSDVNLYWTNLENKRRETIDKMCPLRKMNIKDRGDPWMTNELIEKIRDKDHLRKIAKRSGDEHDWRHAKQAQNEVKHALNKAKSDFINGSITTYAKDNNKNWKQISLLLPEKKSGNKINLTDTNDGHSINSEDAANYLNDFFCKIGANLAKKFKSPLNLQRTMVYKSKQTLMI